MSIVRQKKRLPFTLLRLYAPRLANGNQPSAQYLREVWRGEKTNSALKEWVEKKVGRYEVKIQD